MKKIKDKSLKIKDKSIKIKVKHWFSEIFEMSLILFAITGLFIVKGKKGIRRRGALYTAAGKILP